MRVKVLAGFLWEGGRELGRGDEVELPDAAVPGLEATGRVVRLGSVEQPLHREDVASTESAAPLVATAKGKGKVGRGPRH